MKSTFLLPALALASLLSVPAQAQNETKKQEGFRFTTVKENPITSLKDQYRSGTCWGFSSLAFMESELLRMGKTTYDLSEMFVVYWTYVDKADKYVRTGGHVNLAQGGAFSDFLLVLDKYGMVPEAAFPGLNYGEEKHTHGEMEAVVQGVAEAAKKNPNKKITPAWKKALRGVLDAYLGEMPQTFTYEGKEYTPQSFAKELGFNPKDYVSLTSYTHHPFYTQFALEIPDNWMWDPSWNLPLDEMMAVIDNAIEKGYTVLWAADVSEAGFSRNGVAMAPATRETELSGSDQARWLGLSAAQRNAAIAKMDAPVMEIAHITQEMRQEAFDNQTTTDDHGMQIYGIAKDQNGTKYYMVKNSWGEAGAYKGLWYASEKYVRYKTMDVMVHKDALPKDIRAKLGL